MLKVEQVHGAVIAADTQETLLAYDNALLSSAKMMTSVIEVSQSSNIPAAASQKVLAGLSGGTSHLIEARGCFTSAIRQMALIQSQSDLKETNFGCPDGLPSASLSREINQTA